MELVKGIAIGVTFGLVLFNVVAIKQLQTDVLQNKWSVSALERKLDGQRTSN